jgi:hypothetical protein
MPVSTIGAGGLGRPLGVGSVTNPVHDLQILSASGASGTLSLSGSSSGSTGGASHILMGNSDSAGVTGPNVIQAANRNMAFGVGTSFSAPGGGTVTPIFNVNAGGINVQGVQRTWALGQPTVAGITSGGANLYRFAFNRSLIYFQGITWDVHMSGGKDWGGNGYCTYYARMMVTFLSIDTARVHVIQEFVRSYLNNSGTELVYNTNTVTFDANFLYLTMNYRGVNAGDGYRPQMWITTYDSSYQNQNINSQINSITTL